MTGYIVPIVHVKPSHDLEDYCVLCTQKHIRIEKHAHLPDLAGMGNACLPDWNSYKAKGILVGGFHHSAFLKVRRLIKYCFYEANLVFYM